MAFSPAECERYPNSFGIVGIGQPKTRRLVVHAPRQHLGACKQLFPPQPALNRSGPCRLNATSRSSNRSWGVSGSRASGSHLPVYVVGAQHIFGYVSATSPHFDDEDDGPTRRRLNATASVPADAVALTGQPCEARACPAGQCASPTAHTNTYFASVVLR